MTYNPFYETIILVPAVSFVVAIILKAIAIKLTSKKWNIEQALGSGGMPSVHSAVVVALATAFALKYGVHSDYFAIVLGFTVIIIYDAINVRFEAGLHAKAINKGLGTRELKESLGHLPSEAFAGSFLGMIVAVGLYFL